MIERRQIIMGEIDLLEAIRDYLVKTIENVKPEDVCNYRVSFMNEKPRVEVNLRDTGDMR